MIGRLTGNVVSEEPDGALLIDVGGVAYEVATPLGTLGRVRGAVHVLTDAVTLHVHTHVREDAISLYGFATAEDKAAFRLLISVANIGPKTAMAVLSSMRADELARALVAKDLGKLVSIPGIGKKIAERLLLELKDKLVPKGPAAALAASAGQPHKEEILVRALTGMGYRPSEADRAVGQLRARMDELPVPELIKEALGLLAR
jgi:Holliday junction DNA helicase RuvA